MGPSGSAQLIEKGSGDVIRLSNLDHFAVDALMAPNVFDNFKTGLRISIGTSGKLHRATSGRWWLVTNHNDSASYRHPTTTRGFTETVNWDLKNPGIPNGSIPYSSDQRHRNVRAYRSRYGFSPHRSLFIPATCAPCTKTLTPQYGVRDLARCKYAFGRAVS
jgi:hypothetical protein